MADLPAPPAPTAARTSASPQKRTGWDALPVRWLRRLWWLATVVGTVWLALRWVDAPGGGVLPLLQSMSWPVAVVMFLLWLMAVVLRRWNATVAALPAAIVAVVMVVVPFIPSDRSPGAQPYPTVAWASVAEGERPPTRSLTVLAANVEHAGADQAALLRAVTKHEVDVLMLSEVTPAYVSRLRSSGVGQRLPYLSNQPAGTSAAGTVILSAMPWDSTGFAQRATLPFQMPQGVIRVCGTPVNLLAVHPSPPTFGLHQQWFDGLQDIRAWNRAVRGARVIPPSEEDDAGAQAARDFGFDREVAPAIMAGDFNATVDHPGFRKATRGFADAHRARGQGLVPTWPRGILGLPPLVGIDHVMVRDALVADAGTVTLPGTDHLAVWATVSVGCSGTMVQPNSR